MSRRNKRAAPFTIHSFTLPRWRDTNPNMTSITYSNNSNTNNHNNNHNNNNNNHHNHNYNNNNNNNNNQNNNNNSNNNNHNNQHNDNNNLNNINQNDPSTDINRNRAKAHMPYLLNINSLRLCLPSSITRAEGKALHKFFETIFATKGSCACCGTERPIKDLVEISVGYN